MEVYIDNIVTSIQNGCTIIADAREAISNIRGNNTVGDTWRQFPAFPDYSEKKTNFQSFNFFSSIVCE